MKIKKQIHKDEWSEISNLLEIAHCKVISRKAINAKESL